MSDLSWFRNRFPYTKLNDINLDWLLKRMKELSALVVGYADDIQRALTQSSTAITQSETAVDSANNAVSIANGAAATADAVSGIAEDARTIASAANNTAIHAESVATGIAETAQSALDTAQSAETIAGNAVQTADDAQTTAQNAVSIANGANTRAGNAEQSALTAISTATAAQQVATVAAQDAETAQQDAQTAQQAATAAAQDAETAQQTATAAAGDAQTAQQAATAAAGNAQTAQQAATAAAGDAQTAQQAATTIAINKADIIKETISGNVVNFSDGADGLPLESLVVLIVGVQSGSGNPSPDNIRPISGWTGCNISHSGADVSDPIVIMIDWTAEAGAVYGATLDVLSGVLTVTWVIIRADSVDWLQGTSPTEYRKAFSASALSGNGKKFGVANLISNKYVYDVNAEYRIRGSANSQLVTISDPRFVNDPSTFNASLADTQIAYELETPITIYLTPQDVVTTFFGTNNLWADCGAVRVTYRADTKLYIEKINAPSGNDMIANEQITSGKYFVIGGALYKSTTVIAQGDRVIPGSNCIETNLADALNSLI